ncbi:hypothetical protein [Wolbachia endosymbiont of Folsomia candida]|uniref:hypothetical protein n=1 Tax=Wolbachia endosymbiont of Folsomia candida TaxID=169402 RepID=UPI000ABDD1DB|nr:hypothetical protein [Wolbachia endosymbiont of Folsomia candida]APR98819.1 hypothetical protein ASM33_06350 [Wolbachia endosymbiont of Folsomia candida]
MGKYTNTWFSKKANHDCANDGTCGESIRDFRIGGSDISFYDHYGRTIAQMPRLPGGTPSKHYNKLYESADSKTFYRDPEYIKEVLSNDFVFEHESIRYVINYDNISQQEQEQVKKDIKSAYDAYKAKFCISKLEDNPTVQIYIFNNRSDLQHIKLIPEFRNEKRDFLGITDGKKVLCYKASDMDNTLAHELGHVFQFRFSTAKVKELDKQGVQLMANAIGQEVEEKNHKDILEQKSVDEYREFNGRFAFKHEGIVYDIRYENLSTEEKDQIMKDIKDSHASIISRSKPEKEAEEEQNEVTPTSTAAEIISEQVVPEQNFIEGYNEVTGVFEFKYKGIKYNIQHKDYLSSSEEKAQFIYDIKNSHESLISECHRLNSLNGALSNENATIMIYVDENKDIDGILYYNPGIISTWLNQALISRSNTEEVAETGEESGKSNEVLPTILESEEASKNQVAQEEESNEVEQIDSTEEEQSIVEEEKSNHQDTQQPSQQHSGFLSNIIFPAIESIIGSISSLFSWIFLLNKEEDDSIQQLRDDNLPLFEDVDELIYDFGRSYMDLSNDHYHSSDELM